MGGAKRRGKALRAGSGTGGRPTSQPTTSSPTKSSLAFRTPPPFRRLSQFTFPLSTNDVTAQLAALQEASAARGHLYRAANLTSPSITSATRVGVRGDGGRGEDVVDSGGAGGTVAGGEVGRGGGADESLPG